MILAQHLEKRFATVHAVAGVSLEVRSGEIFGLLGPNGAGKSTTIRMINNIIRPDSGTITYDGAPFSDDVRRRIGYLPEERGLYQKARILETVVYMGRLKGLDERTARSRALGWMESPVYARAAREAMRDQVMAPLARYGIVLDEAACEALLA